MDRTQGETGRADSRRRVAEMTVRVTRGSLGNGADGLGGLAVRGSLPARESSVIILLSALIGIC